MSDDQKPNMPARPAAAREAPCPGCGQPGVGSHAINGMADVFWCYTLDCAVRTFVKDGIYGC